MESYNDSNNVKFQVNDKLCIGPHNSNRVGIIQEESKECSEKSMNNNNVGAENEVNSSASKDISHKMMQKINHQSFENQLADYHLRSDLKN